MLALTTASRVVHLGGSSYETEFVEPGWWLAGWVLVVPVFLAARAHRILAAPAALLAAAPQFLLARAVVVRASTRGGATRCLAWVTCGRPSCRSGS